MWLEFTIKHGTSGIEPIKDYVWYATPLNDAAVTKELSTAKWEYAHSEMTVRKLSTSKLPVKIRQKLAGEHAALISYHKRMFEMLIGEN